MYIIIYIQTTNALVEEEKQRKALIKKKRYIRRRAHRKAEYIKKLEAKGIKITEPDPDRWQPKYRIILLYYSSFNGS